MLLNKIICKRIKSTYIINKIQSPLFKIEETKLEIRSFTMLYENSSIYFLNIFLKIYLTNTNECLFCHLRFNIYFEYDVSIYCISI